MSIPKYEAFLKAVELGSLTKTAEKLGYTQSGVSMMLASLEEELGMSLLNRGRSGVSLTSAGKELLPLMREVVNSHNRILQTAAELKGLKAGTLRIGLLNSISVHYLPEILKSFDKAYPQIHFEFFQGEYKEIEDWIWEGFVDCGFVIKPSARQLELVELIEDPCFVLTAKNHPFREKEVVTMEDMRNEDFIQTFWTNDYAASILFHEASWQPRLKFTTENDYASIAMVRQGLGITLLPWLIVKDFQDQVCVRRIQPTYVRRICIAVRSLEKASPLARVFVDFLKEWKKKETENAAQR